MLKHVKSSTDLLTTHEAVREGFLHQALVKTTKANPYIQQAKELEKALQSVTDVAKLMKIEAVRLELLAAAGFSDKALSKLTTDEVNASVLDVIQKLFDADTSDDKSEFCKELVFRFLLTKGDALGGAMRNYTGAAAGAKFTDAVLKALAAQTIQTTQVTQSPQTGKIQAVQWLNRLLVFDKRSPLIGNNIDVILFDISRFTTLKELLSDASSYLACGELKGGIDPAGADEHWKTARSAFDRIRAKFDTSPKLFFVGAAIERAMAIEIFSNLQESQLDYAANLTNEKQVVALAEWLTRL